MVLSSPFWFNLILKNMEPVQTESTLLSNGTISTVPNTILFLPADFFAIPATYHAAIVSKLTALGGPEESGRRRLAYLFTFASFFCQLLKSQSDLQHLYAGRRAGVR